MSFEKKINNLARFFRAKAKTLKGSLAENSVSESGTNKLVSGLTFIFLLFLVPGALSAFENSNSQSNFHQAEVERVFAIDAISSDKIAMVKWDVPSSNEEAQIIAARSVPLETRKQDLELPNAKLEFALNQSDELAIANFWKLVVRISFVDSNILIPKSCIGYGETNALQNFGILQFFRTGIAISSYNKSLLDLDNLPLGFPNGKIVRHSSEIYVLELNAVVRRFQNFEESRQLLRGHLSSILSKSLIPIHNLGDVFGSGSRAGAGGLLYIGSTSSRKHFLASIGKIAKLNWLAATIETSLYKVNRQPIAFANGLSTSGEKFFTRVHSNIRRAKPSNQNQNSIEKIVVFENISVWLPNPKESLSISYSLRCDGCQWKLMTTKSVNA